MIIEATIKQLPRLLPIRRLSLTLIAARSTDHPEFSELKIMGDVKWSLSRTHTHAARMAPLPEIVNTIKVRETLGVKLAPLTCTLNALKQLHIFLVCAKQRLARAL